MPRKKLIPRLRRESSTGGRGKLDAATKAYFLTGERVGGLPPESRLREIWNERRDALVAEFITTRPGRRPHRWWLADAPGELRRQVGGLGVLLSDVPRLRNLYVAPSFGVPSFDEIDEANPPVFESQATYLRRHGLLAAGELERIEPEAFEPEPLE